MSENCSLRALIRPNCPGSCPAGKINDYSSSAPSLGPPAGEAAISERICYSGKFPLVAQRYNRIRCSKFACSLFVWALQGILQPNLEVAKPLFCLLFLLRFCKKSTSGPACFVCVFCLLFSFLASLRFSPGSFHGIAHNAHIGVNNGPEHAQEHIHLTVGAPALFRRRTCVAVRSGTAFFCAQQLDCRRARVVSSPSLRRCLAELFRRCHRVTRPPGCSVAVTASSFGRVVWSPSTRERPLSALPRYGARLCAAT